MINHILTLPLRVLAACFALCSSVHSATFTVTTTADEFDTPSGTNLSLREAVRDAAAADTINFDPSLSGQSINLNSTLVLNKNLTIDASPAGIKLLGTGRVVEVMAGRTVVLRKLELRNGWSTQGGGIHNAGTLTLDSCTITNNGDGTAFGGGPTHQGGGIYNAGTLTLNQCTLTGNIANTGAAIFNQSGANLAVNNSTITGNDGMIGTGGINNAGSLTLSNTVVSGNTGGGPSDPNLSNTGALSVVVTTANDSGLGSLREVVASAPYGATIVFASDLNGQTITLTGGEIPLNTTRSIDVSALSRGLTISGNNAGRIFNIGASGNITLVGLTLRNGRAANDHGGAIFNQGVLSVNRCTLSGNTATLDGGGIFNPTGSNVTLLNSTFVGNTAREGGAVRCTGASLTATNCTFTANTATIGGACSIADGGPEAQLIHLTIVGNTATAVTYGGGGLFFYAQNASLHNSIVAANTSSVGGGDIDTIGSNLTLQGTNLVQSHSGGMLGTAPMNQAPLLATLGNYGGPTQTMPPLLGSPAIDAAVGSISTTDQRGFPISGIADIGAVESALLVTTGVDQLDTPSGAEVSLREAVRDCPPDGVIGFASALSGGTCVLNTALGGEIVLNKSVTIDASSLLAGITIDGGAGTNRIFSIPAGQTVTLNRLTLTGGEGTGAAVPGSGGAIYNASSMLTLNHCSFQGHSASHGGGIFNEQSSPTLNNCSFQGNSALLGGGGINNRRSSPTLNNCSFQGNSALSGGGIYNNNASPTLNNCSFQGNSASGSGGGIYSFGIGGLTLSNCIIWRNNGETGTGTAASSVFISFHGSETYSHCLIQGLNPEGTGNLDGTLASNNPLFVLEVDPNSAPTTGGNLRLLAGSPAIEAGDNTKNPTTTDLAGNPRFSGTIDLGAYEMPAPVLRPVTIAADNANTSWAKPGDTVTLTFTANEPIQTPVVTMFGNTVSAINTGGNIWTASMTANGGTTEGVATFSISATDLAGNLAAPVTATTDGTAVTVDKTQPILTAPGDKIERVYGVSSAAVSFTAGTSDNLDPAPVLVANPASGSLFPIGETTVILSLTDAAGNASVGSFKVTVRLLTTGEDTDGDGLNDVAEFQMSTLGFNWQVSQPELVNTLMTNANTAGLFTPGQVQTLHVGTPLISQASPGRFRLTLGVQKSTNLTNPFTDFSLTGPGTTTEFTDGKLKFEFPATDNAAFFRIKTE